MSGPGGAISPIRCATASLADAVGVGSCVFAFCGRTPGAAWARSSWRATRNCTARWPSRRSRTRHADNPDSRRAFVLEAEITGGLEHPGIVPVYGLGHYADGRPFYAMRFIKGDSLKDGDRAIPQAAG